MKWGGDGSAAAGLHGRLPRSRVWHRHRWNLEAVWKRPGCPVILWRCPCGETRQEAVPGSMENLFKVIEEKEAP